MAIKTGLYRHYKGPYYHVTEVAQHSETQEHLVVYRALYGDKGVWVRPLSMFTETVERDGVFKPRFAYIDPQTEVLELAILDVISGQENQFEVAFQEAKAIIIGSKGYISHDLQRCIESSNRYVLLVKWQTLEDHTICFRESAEYQQWKKLLHHFYQPFPVVEHFKCL
jgi:hypothetical protein